MNKSFFYRVLLFGFWTISTISVRLFQFQTCFLSANYVAKCCQPPNQTTTQPIYKQAQNLCIAA